MKEADAPLVLACPCGEVYDLKPEYAGRLLECPVCGRQSRAGVPAGGSRHPIADLDPAFDRDVFLLRERVLTIRSKYEVWAEDGRPMLYVERPTYPIRTFVATALGLLAAGTVLVGTAGLRSSPDPVAGLLGLLALLLALVAFYVVSASARPKRHVTVYRDESRRDVLLRIRQDQRVAVVVRTYTVVAAAGTVLARLRRDYLRGLLRKRWSVESETGQAVALAIEDSLVLSLLRRILGSFFGLLRTNFVLLADEGAGQGAVLGEFNRKFTLLDRYVLDLRADAERRLDRRVAVALGIMLDTGERR